MRLFLTAILLSALAFGQSFQGTLRGRVLDSGGAAAAGAHVTITDESTQVPRATIANDQGEYVFNAVNPATYTVSVEQSGFKKLERKGVEVATQAVVAVDLTLEIGQVSESVNVIAEAPALQTADASTGQLIDSQKITDLPNLGRNPFFIGKLAQAVVFVANPKFARMQDQNGNSQVSIGGGPLRTNNYLIDGISIADSNNRAVILPSPEAVEELKVQANTYDAEVGRTGGGSFNTLLRGGTNDLHGTAVGHIRETAWIANNFFANRAGQPVPDQPFRDWAFSLGGPIVIPHVYNGRNKTFFFASDESYREIDGSTTTLSVPTALELTGNFSQSFTRSGAHGDHLRSSEHRLSTARRFPLRTTRFRSASKVAIGQRSLLIIPARISPRLTTERRTTVFTGSYPNRGDQRTV